MAGFQKNALIQQDPGRLRFALLNCVREYKYFEFTTYFITLHQKTQRLLRQEQIDHKECMFLGIGPGFLVLLEPDTLLPCLQVRYSEIKRLEVHSNSIMLRVTNVQLDGEIWVRTEEPFEIATGMSIYSELSKVCASAAHTD